MSASSQIDSYGLGCVLTRGLSWLWRAAELAMAEWGEVVN